MLQKTALFFVLALLSCSTEEPVSPEANDVHVIGKVKDAVTGYSLYPVLITCNQGSVPYQTYQSHSYGGDGHYDLKIGNITNGNLIVSYSFNGYESHTFQSMVSNSGGFSIEHDVYLQPE